VSAVEALRVAHAAGVTVTVEGESLVLEALAQPPDPVLPALSLNKGAIVALLRQRQHEWRAEQWRLQFEKRVSIAEASGVPRPKAEEQAFACCVIEWLNQHPTPSAPGRCVWCGQPESPSAVVLPFGCGPGTHAWLHAECWHAWHQRRRGEAIAALRAAAIAPGLSQ
jgi:hypothetical protein